MDGTKELINGIKAGLLQWYPFAKNSRILLIGDEHPLASVLSAKGHEVHEVNLSDAEREDRCLGQRGEFDYIVSIAALEQSASPTEVLKTWRALLRPEGKLLLGMNNRWGLRYFCGDRDIYTGRNFDGIENYNHVDGICKPIGRMYSRAELARLLWASGWAHFRFYSVLSDLENPAFVFAEDFLPNEDLANRLFPTYHSPDTVFLREEELQGDLVENGLFHAMANAYLIECSLLGEFSDVLHVTCSMERGKANAFFTILHRSGQVEKQAAYPEGRNRLQSLAANMEALRHRGVPVVDGKLEGNRYVMPYIDALLGHLYLKQLIRTNRKKFLQAMDDFRDAILQSSEIEIPDQGDGTGAILVRGYWDMVPLNSFYINGRFVFFDQEFCMDSCPANFVVFRMVGAFYCGNPDFEKLLPMGELLKRYGLMECIDRWQRMNAECMAELRREEPLALYHERTRRNDAVVCENRQRMGYSYEAYQRIFADIFRDVRGKDIVIFGAGRFAEKFFAAYGSKFSVRCIVDNDSTRWGKEAFGVLIQSPESLKGVASKPFKVFICMRNYVPVERQLWSMGMKDYAVFDPNRDYPLMENCVAGKSLWEPEKADTKKPYRVGYIAGVFDLFHIGHLNLFRRAKAQCEYLIVGVVSDRGVTEKKRVELFVPFKERVEIVRSCRYVDEVVEIPFIQCDTDYAWHQYHFDVQFSGSDYKHDNGWLAKKAFLEERGATMVFFPYTETTSSSKLKKLIEKKLL